MQSDPPIPNAAEPTAPSPSAWWRGLDARTRRRLRIGLLCGLAFVLVASVLLARFLQTENAERDADLALIQAEARGDVRAMLDQLSGCRSDPACVASVRANAANPRLRRAGEVKILQLTSNTAYSLAGAVGKTRFAWTVIGELPVVQCIGVRRTGNFISGIERDADQPERADRKRSRLLESPFPQMATTTHEIECEQPRRGGLARRAAAAAQRARARRALRRRRRSGRLRRGRPRAAPRPGRLGSGHGPQRRRAAKPPRSCSRRPSATRCGARRSTSTSCGSAWTRRSARSCRSSCWRGRRAGRQAGRRPRADHARAECAGAAHGDPRVDRPRGGRDADRRDDPALGRSRRPRASRCWTTSRRPSSRPSRLPVCSRKSRRKSNPRPRSSARPLRVSRRRAARRTPPTRSRRCDAPSAATASGGQQRSTG